MSFTLRPMTEDDLPAGYRLTQKMQWPHRPEDWQQALSLGQGVVAVKEQQIVGCALCWRWGDQRSTLGLVIVDPQAQGCGIGNAMITRLLETLSGSIVRLHATEMGLGLYRKFGFAVQGSVHQHQIARLPRWDPPQLAAGQQIRRLREDELPLVTEFDRQAHGLFRPALYQQLFGTAELWVAEQQQQIQGVVCLRRFGHGYQAGPLIARDEATARLLFTHCAARREGDFLRIDTRGETGFSDWLSDSGLPVVDAPLLMIRGTLPAETPGAMLDFGFMTQAMG